MTNSQKVGCHYDETSALYPHSNTGCRKCLQAHHLQKDFIMTYSDEVNDIYIYIYIYIPGAQLLIPLHRSDPQK